MRDFVEENRQYETITILSENEKRRIELVRSPESSQIFIRKTLNRMHTVYGQLRGHHFSGIPAVHSVTEVNGQTIVIEEFLNGETLAEYLQGHGTVEDGLAAQWMAQLCRILESLHQCNLIHRDIKPSNLIVMPDLSLRLIDFDAARTAEPQKTEDTVLLGTKGYAAPEQYGYAQTDARTDIYAIGTVINQALTGSLPQKELYCGKLAAVIQTCVQIDPARRFSSCGALLQALRLQYPQLVPNGPAPLAPPGAAAPGIPPAEPSDPAHAAPSYHLWWRLAICILFTILLALLYLLDTTVPVFWTRMANFGKSVWVFLPFLAMAVDLFRIRSRPPIPFFRRPEKIGLFVCLYFLLWLIGCMAFL